MKSNLLTLLIIGFILVSCKNNSLSDSYWLALKSYPIPPETGNNIYDGMTIHFTNNELIFGDVYYKGTGNYNLRFEDKKIFRNDTLWAEIFAEYQDSIILDISQSARVKFVKLDKKHSIKELPELWEHKNWILTFKDYQRELFLTDSLFFDEPDSKLLIQKDLQDNQFTSTIDKWKAVNINENQLFVKSYHQMDNEFYRIKNYVGDSIIVLESLEFPDVKTDLRKRQYISELKRQEIFNQIQNHEWKTDKIIELDTIGEGGGNWDATLIKFESLKEKQLSFRFSNDLTYNIYESNISVANGNWKLSPTGNEIVLNYGLNPTDYIDLINVSADKLEIGSLRWFEPKGNNYGMDIEMYYKIILKK